MLSVGGGSWAFWTYWKNTLFVLVGFPHLLRCHLLIKKKKIQQIGHFSYNKSQDSGQRICYQCDSCFNPVSEAKVRSKSSAWTICCCLRGAKGVAEGFSLHVLKPGEKFIKHTVHLMVSLNNQFVLSSFDLCGCIEGKRTSSKLSLPQKIRKGVNIQVQNIWKNLFNFQVYEICGTNERK